MTRTIPELLEAMRLALARARVVRVGLGADAGAPAELAAQVESWTAYAGRLVSLAANTTGLGIVVAQLDNVVLSLNALAAEAKHYAGNAASDPIDAIRDRVAKAAADIAKGARDVFSSFWGFEPGDPLKFIAAIVGVVVLGGVAVLFTPAGQGVMLALGAGYGSSIGAIGGGAGKAIANVNLTALVRGGM